MKNRIANKQYDEERALYNLRDTLVEDCVFAGPADGESAFKEARNVALVNCSFSLRYPLWHTEGFTMDRCTMDEKTRAAIWYAKDGTIRDCDLGGIKALRECHNVTIENSRIVSQEFGWKSRGITLQDTSVQAEYLFLDCRDIKLQNVKMKGKYSFQYVENLEINDSVLDTKDAFWHAKNVTVRNSTVKGEYLAWFSEGLTLINCHIEGTQPLCYCKDLKLINCTMSGTDLAFEYSDVEAEVWGRIQSVKNPKSGTITADAVGEVVRGDEVMECTGQVIIRGGENQGAHDARVRIVPGAKKAVLMTHGIVSTPRHFDFLQSVVPEDVTCVSILLDGHGGTVQDFSRTSMKKWKAQVDAWVDRLCQTHEQVYLVGYSMGTLLSAEAALNYPKVAGLLLLNVPLDVWVAPKIMMFAPKFCFDKIKDNSPEAEFLTSVGVEPDKYLWRYWGWVPRFLELLKLCQKSKKRFRTLQLPNRMFQSDGDELVFPTTNRYVKNNPNIQNRILESCGHANYTPEAKNEIRQALWELLQ